MLIFTIAMNQIAANFRTFKKLKLYMHVSVHGIVTMFFLNMEW